MTVGEPETKACPRAEPMVQIHLPPAERVHETSVPAGLHSARRGAGSGRLITGSRPERSASRGYGWTRSGATTKLIFMMLPLRLLPRKRANVMEYRGEPFAVLNRILASSPKRPDRAHRGCERQGSENYSLTSP